MATATKDYWIQTISGKKFSYLDPQPESIFGIAIPVQRFRSCDVDVILLSHRNTSTTV